MSTPELSCTACGQVIATEEPHDVDTFRCDDCVARGQIAHCPCGKSFARPDWVKLALVGTQPMIEADGSESQTRVLELRNCSCGSTRTIIASKRLPDPVLAERRAKYAHPKNRRPAAPRVPATFVLDFDGQCNRVQLHGLITKAGRERTEQALWEIYSAARLALKEDESVLVVLIQADEYKLWLRRADSGPMSGAEQGEAVDLLHAIVEELEFSFA